MNIKWRRAIAAIISATAVVMSLTSAATAAPKEVETPQSPVPCGKYLDHGDVYFRTCSPPSVTVTGWDNLYEYWHCWYIPGFTNEYLGIADWQYGLDYDSIHVTNC